MMNTLTFDTQLLADGHLYCPAELTHRPNARFQVTVTFEESAPRFSNPTFERFPPHAGSLLLAYLTAELSLGELAQQLKLTYPETRDWLSCLGIPTVQNLSPELEQFTQENFLKFIQQRGIHRPQEPDDGHCSV